MKLIPPRGEISPIQEVRESPIGIRDAFIYISPSPIDQLVQTDLQSTHRLAFRCIQDVCGYRRFLRSHRRHLRVLSELLQITNSSVGKGEVMGYRELKTLND